jgi:hypothetical protein
MAILNPATAQERADGIAESHRLIVRLAKKHGVVLNFPITKQDLDDTLGAIWDGLESVNYRALMSEPLKTDMPDKLVFLLIAETVSRRLELLKSGLGG